MSKQVSKPTKNTQVVVPGQVEPSAPARRSTKRTATIIEDVESPEVTEVVFVDPSPPKKKPSIHLPANRAPIGAVVRAGAAAAAAAAAPVEAPSPPRTTARAAPRLNRPIHVLEDATMDLGQESASEEGDEDDVISAMIQPGKEGDKTRFRHWSFTHNNPKAGYENFLVEQLMVNHNAVYVVVGKEVGKCGTPHLQGHVSFKDGKTFTAVRKMGLGHISPVRELQNHIDYCMKDGNYIHEGVRPVDQAGKGEKEKNRWQEAIDCARLGKFEEVHPQIQIMHFKNLGHIHHHHVSRVTTRASVATLDNWWFVGPTGTGKSFTARGMSGNCLPAYYSKLVNKWWDAYKAEPIVIMDEFGADRPSALLDAQVGHLKMWADHYAFNAEVKGGHILARPKSLVITSNYFPAEFVNAHDLGPILRRFKVVWFGRPKECAFSYDMHHTEMPPLFPAYVDWIHNDAAGLVLSGVELEHYRSEAFGAVAHFGDTPDPTPYHAPGSANAPTFRAVVPNMRAVQLRELAETTEAQPVEATLPLEEEEEEE